MLKSIMLENEMEKYLKDNGHKFEDDERTNSMKVAGEAIKLGYDSYVLDWSFGPNSNFYKKYN